jgi:hypothetical protein
VIARRKSLTTAVTVFLASTMSALIALAQQAKVDVTTNETTSAATTTTTWYANPWIWAAGVGVFLIIVIALTSRGGRST